MASYAAHLSRRVRASDKKASIFDIVAEESLRTSLLPAWNFTVDWLVDALQPCDSVVIRSVKRFRDEIYYGILLMFDQHYLRWKSASFTESFYDMARKSSAPTSTIRSRHSNLLSILTLTALPYSIEKIEQYHQKLTECHIANETFPQAKSESTLEYTKWIFYKLYPFIRAALKLIKFVLYILFIFDYTRHSSLELFVTSIELKCAAASTAQRPVSSSQEDLKQTTQQSSLRLVCSHLSSGMFTLISRLPPILFFCVELLDAWFARDATERRSITSPPIPPPPTSTGTKSYDRLMRNPAVCGICNMERVRPTALSSSGYVFCHDCIVEHVKDEAVCPITGISSSLDSIVPLYYQD